MRLSHRTRIQDSPHVVQDCRVREIASATPIDGVQMRVWGCVCGRHRSTPPVGKVEGSGDGSRKNIGTRLVRGRRDAPT